jgi:hypothetical protein
MTLSVVPVLLSAGKLAEGAEEVGSLDESEYYEACGLAAYRYRFI